MTHSLVSVVIPTHNRASLLARSIQSALDQSYRPIEILVADDGSTDDTAARARSFGDPVRLIQLEYSGRPGLTRNRAIAHARGEFVAFLDDDDIWSPEKLQSQVQIMTTDAAVGLVFTNARFLFADGQRSDPLFDPPTTRGNMFSGLLRDCFIHPSTAVIRKSTLDAAGWFDEELTIAEDLDLWLRVARIAEMAFLPESHVMIQKHKRQNSTNREPETWQNTLTVLHRLRHQSGISLADRLRIRRTLAKTHNHLALLASGPEVKRQYLRAVRWNPLTRAGWKGLLRGIVANRS